MELEACCRHSSLEAKLDRAPKAGERFPTGKGPGSCSTEDGRVATVQQILASCDGDTSAIGMQASCVLKAKISALLLTLRLPFIPTSLQRFGWTLTDNLHYLNGEELLCYPQTNL